jgi:hypothetical protein
MTLTLDWNRIESKDDEIPQAYRAKVPGGWLVAITCTPSSVAATFVPDPDHRWTELEASPSPEIA